MALTEHGETAVYMLELVGEMVQDTDLSYSGRQDHTDRGVININLTI